uniref:P450-1 n=1 Tax=Phialomyces arenicola TaxID=168477 RepID=A0A6H0XBD9_9EURO|nr:P450-1 [Phialomyces arenicola]
MLPQLAAHMEQHLDGLQALLCTASVLLAIGVIFRLRVGHSSIHNKFWKAQPWDGSNLSVELLMNSSLADETEPKFSKKGKAFALPTFGEAPWVVLPPSSIRELLSKSDMEVDMEVIHEEQLQIYYTQGPLGFHAVNVPIQYNLVRRQLTRKLPLLIHAIYDELDRGFKQYWGTDANAWTDVKASETCTKIVTRAANRVFTGAEICQNEAFLEHSRLYSEGVATGGIIIRMLPRWLRPVFAPLVTYPNRKNLNICLKICVPVVKDRLQDTMEKRANAAYKWEAPVDGLQWLIEECLNRNDPKETDPVLITQRLLMLNFVAIETTAMSMTNTVLDLFGSPDSDDFVAGLREECDRVLKENDGQWTKSALDNLLRVDSTIRESMRYSDLGYIALTRMVVDPQGIDLKADDTDGSSPLHIPVGIRVCVPAHAIHRDPSFHQSPYTFNAFRFSDGTEDNKPPQAFKKDDGQTRASLEEQKGPSLVTTTDTFLVFGHGRHACPGRFFAALEMKLMLAYLIQWYDVEKLSKRPEKQVMVGTARPNANLNLSVRRRRGSVRTGYS